VYFNDYSDYGVWIETTEDEEWIHKEKSVNELNEFDYSSPCYQSLSFVLTLYIPCIMFISPFITVYYS
jgi:hypothetical protein